MDVPFDKRWWDGLSWAFHKAQALPRLRARQWNALGRAWWLMFQVRRQLRRRPFSEAWTWVNERALVASQASHHRSSPAHILWAVERATWFQPWKCTCFHRALTARILLAQQGWPAELHIGGRRDEKGRFEAHAWLECEGRVVLGALPDLDSYKRFEGEFDGAGLKQGRRGEAARFGRATEGKKD